VVRTFLGRNFPDSWRANSKVAEKYVDRATKVMRENILRLMAENGVAGACQRCGTCCRLVVELVGGMDDIPEELTEFVKEDGREIEIMKQIDGMCIAFKDNACSIYDTRPMVCRDFQVQESRCKIGERRKSE